MPDRAQVERFLTTFKEIASSEGNWYLAPRNYNHLSELSLTEAGAKKEILDLSLSDYCKGPEADDNWLERGNVFVFGKEINGTEIYIKLKIAYIGKQKIAKCLSFHAAEKRLEYPFAE